MAAGRRRAPVKRRTPDLSRALAPALRLSWVLLVLAGVGAIAAGWWGPDRPPAGLPAAGAVTVSTCYAVGLGARTGGRPFVSGALALAVGLAGVLSRLPVLAAAAAVGTAVLAAVLGVLATTPAARFRRGALEVAVSVVTVAFGALAAAAYQPQVSPMRVGYLCLGLSLLTAMGLVHRLGAGLTGLGTRGVVMVLGGLVLLAVTLAYSQALARWGSPEMVEAVRRGTVHVQPPSAPSPGRSSCCSASRPWPGGCRSGPAAGRAGGCAPSARPASRRPRCPCSARDGRCPAPGWACSTARWSGCCSATC